MAVIIIDQAQRAIIELGGETEGICEDVGACGSGGSEGGVSVVCFGSTIGGDWV